MASSVSAILGQSPLTFCENAAEATAWVNHDHGSAAGIFHQAQARQWAAQSDLQSRVQGVAGSTRKQR
jgi:hypothetical protein